MSEAEVLEEIRSITDPIELIRHLIGWRRDHSFPIEHALDKKAKELIEVEVICPWDISLDAQCPRHKEPMSECPTYTGLIGTVEKLKSNVPGT